MAEATREDVWVSTPTFAHHIGLAHVARKNGLVKVQLRAEDTLRMHPEEEVHRLAAARGRREVSLHGMSSGRADAQEYSRSVDFP